MIKLIYGATLLLLTATALAEETRPTVYDPDPQHLLNRLYTAIATRVEGGERFGVDNVTPFYEPFDDSAQVAALAEELIASKAVLSSLSDLKRALLLHDVWTAFDTAAAFKDRKTLRPLARAVRVLAMDDQSIARLPDNYEAAAKSGAFLRDFNPTNPDRAFLPPDLFDPQGPWVQIGETGTGHPLARMHVDAASARSAFMVFIRCPGGREATLAYLNALNLFRAPFTLSENPIGTRYDPDGKHPVRMDVVRINPQTPQIPAGTIFSLVRQMAVVNDKLQPVMTKITQSVQFRVYKTNDWDFTRDSREAFARSQSPFEITMTRADLLAGRAGGLHRVADDEAFPTLAGIVRLEWTRAQRLKGHVVMPTCPLCHSGSGILSVNTYTARFDRERNLLDRGPSLMPADYPEYQRETTMARKRQRYEWGVLQGLLADD